jgi:hypothetical protein
MRKHRLIACGVLLIGTATVGAAVAQGGPPGAGSALGKAPHAGKIVDKGKAETGKSDPAHGKSDQAHGKADPAHGKSDQAHGKSDQAHGKLEGAGKEGTSPGRGGHRGAMRGLLEDFRAGKLKKGELKEHLGKLRANMAERRAQHQSELKTRWGAVLAMPSAKQELEHHARRMARLNRAALLAETEVTKDKDKLVERIQKLIDKEQERHERAMTRFKSMPNAPGASTAIAVEAAPADKGGAK